MKKALLAISLVLVMSLCACGEATDVQIKAVDAPPAVTATPEPTPRPTPTPEPVILEPVEPSATEQIRAADQKEYVLNTSTMKFHKPSCSSVKDIKAENRQDFTGVRDDVINMGYQPCKKCNP